jgi:hypothetical protein
MMLLASAEEDLARPQALQNVLMMSMMLLMKTGRNNKMLQRSD